MKKSLFWFLAVVITLAALAYQRLTGPTYPFRGKAAVGAMEIKYRLPRSAQTTKDCEVAVKMADPAVSGQVVYMRYKTEDPWTTLDMTRKDDSLVAFLPKQPSAGKLAYRVILVHEGRQISLTAENPLVIRFKDHVPIWVVVPHVIIIFLGMLFSIRAGFEALDPKSKPRGFAILATVFLILGGFLFGPLMQKFAFGVWWTGFPLGSDLTDTKTLISIVAWIIALVANRKGKRARGWVLAAALITLVVFLIPHSVLGSELDYSTLEAPK